ncbi:MAG: hypothetical protein JWN86_2698 [Planctomycetota bacterium]|nr:hypothetical protein [Planctomycetota bacterium]
MRRFNILSLMGLVLALAVGLAALRGANESWAGGLLLVTPLLLCIALVGALCGKERSRAGRLGFAAFGGAYFALAFLGLSEGNLGKLPTSKLLWLVHERAAGVQQFMVTFTTTTTQSTPGGPPPVLTVNTMPAGPGAPALFRGAGQFLAVNDTLVAAMPNRWQTMLPGAANYEPFSAVGHCLFALLAGLPGAVIARWFERGRVAAAPESGSSSSSRAANSASPTG